MSTEIRNWDLVAKAMEAAGSTSSQMYIRAKALADGKPDPMPTSFPQAPHSISAVAGWAKGCNTHKWIWMHHAILNQNYETIPIVLLRGEGMRQQR